MPPEISQLLIKKLQNESLLAFHLGNFKISDKFLQKLVFQFVNTRSLLLLSMENIDMSEITLNYLQNSFKKNGSIICLSLVGPNMQNHYDKFKYDSKGDAIEEDEDFVAIQTAYLDEKSVYDIGMNPETQKIDKIIGRMGTKMRTGGAENTA